MASNNQKRDTQIPLNSSPLWGGEEAFSFQPIQSGAAQSDVFSFLPIQNGAAQIDTFSFQPQNGTAQSNVFSFQPIQSRDAHDDAFSFQPLQSGAAQSDAFSFQPLRSGVIHGGVDNHLPFSSMPLTQSNFYGETVYGNDTNLISHSYGDNWNSILSSNQTNNSPVNPAFDAFITNVKDPFKGNLAGNYLCRKGSQNLDLNRPAVNLSGIGSNLVTVNRDAVESFHGIGLTSELSSSAALLGQEYENWMMSSAFQPSTSGKLDGSFLSLGNTTPGISTFQDSLTRSPSIQPPCQGLSTPLNYVLGGSEDSHNYVPYYSPTSGLNMDQSFNLSSQQGPMHRYMPMRNNTIPAVGNKMSGEFYSTAPRANQPLKLAMPESGCDSVTRLPSETVLARSSHQTITEELDNLVLSSNSAFPFLLRNVWSTAGTQGGIEKYEQPGRPISAAGVPHNNSDEGTSLFSDQKFRGTSDVSHEDPRKLHSPEGILEIPAAAEEVATWGRSHLFEDPGSVGRSLLKRGSHQHPSPALFTKQRKVTGEQFIQPSHSSSLSLPQQNAMGKSTPTTSSHLNHSPNCWNSSPIAMTPTLISQSVASPVKMTPLQNTLPFFAPVSSGFSPIGYANTTVSHNNPSLAPSSGSAIQIPKVPNALRNNQSPGIKFPDPSFPSSSMLNNMPQTTHGLPFPSRVANTPLQKAAGKLSQGSPDPADTSIASACSGPVALQRNQEKSNARGRNPTSLPKITPPAVKQSKMVYSANQKYANSAANIERLLPAYQTAKTLSHPRIKWQAFEKSGPSGFKCLLCKRDLAFTPEGPISVPVIPPEVAILACGHTFHDQCLHAITPVDQRSNPPCIPCAIGES